MGRCSLGYRDDTTDPGRSGRRDRGGLGRHRGRRAVGRLRVGHRAVGRRGGGRGRLHRGDVGLLLHGDHPFSPCGEIEGFLSVREKAGLSRAIHCPFT